jgi:hypothetical protein
MTLPRGYQSPQQQPQPGRTMYLPPEVAVRIAWELSGQYSSNPVERNIAQKTKEKLRALEETVITLDPKTKGAQYISAALAVIGGTERSLQTIIAGRDLNMKEEDQLREESQKNILYFSQFSSDLQSIIPRIGSMTIVGAGGGIAVTELFGEILQELPSYVFPLIIALAAAIGYLLHGLVVVPIVKKKLQRDKIRADYDRDLYYMQYIGRTTEILKDLYESLERIHRTHFSNDYPGGAEAAEIVNKLMQGVRPTLCEYVHKHMKNIYNDENKNKRNKRRWFRSIIDDSVWAMCESREGVKDCPWYKKERGQ